jgi:hypothetical protein
MPTVVPENWNSQDVSTDIPGPGGISHGAKVLLLLGVIGLAFMLYTGKDFYYD